jgi:cytidylate kinase
MRTHEKRVNTISCQFGSGGHSIGRSVAEQLGIPYYDKEILGRIASETGFTWNFIENASEYATSNNSFLWNLVMKNSSPHVPEKNPADVIYFT